VPLIVAMVRMWVMTKVWLIGELEDAIESASH